MASWHAEALSRAGIAVVVSKPDVVAISIDQLRFAEYDADAGFPIIPTWTTLRSSGRFVVKERYGAGSRTARSKSGCASGFGASAGV